MEIDFIEFVSRGANRKKYFLVKEDRPLKEDILKSILENDDGEVSSIVKEARFGRRGGPGFWKQGKAAKGLQGRAARGRPEDPGQGRTGGEERLQERRRGDRRPCRKPVQRGHRQDDPRDSGHSKAAPGGEFVTKKRPGKPGRSSRI